MSFEPVSNLQGQTAIIAGAGGGIGLAVAQVLADCGARVIGLVRKNTKHTQKQFDQLPNPMLNHWVLQADVTNSTQLTQAAEALDRCDILVNAAGHSKTIAHAEFDLLTDDYFDDMLTVNLRAVFSTVRTFLPLLRKSPTALIVNIGSTSALKSGYGSNLAYVAAKAGVESLTKNLARALAPGIRVISVAPGAMNTGFLEHPSEYYERMGHMAPMQRVATPADVAQVIRSCATQMRFVTGHCFVVDGGVTI